MFTLGMDFKEAHTGTPASLIARLDEFTEEVGNSPKAVNWNCLWGGDFRGDWVKDFPTEVLTLLWERGIVGIVNWIPDNVGGHDILRRIADGEFDDYLTEWARDAKFFGKKVIVRPMFEMNGDWFFWSANVGLNTAGGYRQAWRRIYSIVKPIASNVEFFWCAATSNKTEMSLCYPGDNYVQYTGIDLYKMWNTPGTFLDIADKWMPQLLAVSSKPIILGEVGVSDYYDWETRKSFLRSDEGFEAVVAKYPKIKCICYFNVDATGLGENVNRDWRLDAEPSIMYTWSRLAADPDTQGQMTQWNVKA